MWLLLASPSKKPRSILQQVTRHQCHWYLHSNRRLAADMLRSLPDTDIAIQPVSIASTQLHGHRQSLAGQAQQNRALSPVPGGTWSRVWLNCHRPGRLQHSWSVARLDSERALHVLAASDRPSQNQTKIQAVGRHIIPNTQTKASLKEVCVRDLCVCVCVDKVVSTLLPTHLHHAWVVVLLSAY
jgi:hypothetical protein